MVSRGALHGVQRQYSRTALPFRWTATADCILAKLTRLA